MRLRRTLLAGTAIVLMLGLSACRPATPSGPAERPDPVVTPGAVEAAIAATFVPPELVFGGSCDDLLSEDEVGGILGAPVSLERRDMPRIRNLGGMRCNWQSDGTLPILQLIVLPAGVLTIGEQEGCRVDALTTDMRCDVDTTVNGIRVSGAVMQAATEKGTSLQAAADKVEAVVAERMAAAVAVAAPVVSATAWTSTCPIDALQADPGIRALIVGEPSFGGGRGTDGDHSAFPADAEINARTDATADCFIGYLDGDSYSFIYSALGGGRWNESLLAALPGAHYVDVDGFDAVIVRPLPDGGGWVIVDAFVDDNWISTTVPEPEPAYPVLAAIVARLS